MKHQYFLAIIYNFKRFNMFAEEILNNIIRHACHISTSRLWLTKILENIRSKLYIYMLNIRYMWHLLYCKTFCKTGITEYSLENFLQSLTDLTNLPTCTNPGASSNGKFHWSAKAFAFREPKVRYRIVKKKPKLRGHFHSEGWIVVAIFRLY